MYELIKAFYPGNEIVSLYEEDEADYDIRFRVSRDEEGYTISYNNGIEKKTAHGAVIEGQSSGEASDALISCNVFQDIPLTICDGNCKSCFLRTYQILISHISGDLRIFHSGLQHSHSHFHRTDACKISPGKCLSCSFGKHLIQGIFDRVFIFSADIMGIIARNKGILKNIDYENGYSLYVGIPFCPSICLYCSFSSYPLERWRKYVEAYLDALVKEIRAVSGMMKNRKLDTVYIGGGTPTTLEPDQLRRLLGAITEYFPCEELEEFTVEAGRPDSITLEKLQAIREFPVTRISVNPQTMNQETLDIIGRRHTEEQTKNAFHLARKAGFDNINMDLIVGLPGEDITKVQHTLDEVKALGPDSLTVHSLAVKRAARLNIFRDKYQERSISRIRSCVVSLIFCTLFKDPSLLSVYSHFAMPSRFLSIISSIRVI